MGGHPHTQACPQAQQGGQGGREERRGDEGQAILLERLPGLGKCGAGHDPELPQDIGGGDPAPTFQGAVDEHGHTEPLQEQHQERQQVGTGQRPAVGRHHHGPQGARGQRQRRQPLRQGTVEPLQLRQGFGLHAQSHQDGAHLQLGHGPVQHGAEEAIGLLLGQVARTAAAHGDGLETLGGVHTLF